MHCCTAYLSSDNTNYLLAILNNSLLPRPPFFQVLIQEGTNPPVDLVNEAKLAQEGIKLARRETSENAVCDTALTGVVDQVATMVTNLVRTLAHTHVHTRTHARAHVRTLARAHTHAHTAQSHPHTHTPTPHYTTLHQHPHPHTSGHLC